MKMKNKSILLGQSIAGVGVLGQIFILDKS